MEVKTITVLSAEKHNFKKCTLRDDTSSKLEFTSDAMSGYQIRYDNQDLGRYSTNNPDLMILRSLSLVASSIFF